MSTSHAMTQGGRTCAACTRYLAALLLGVPLSVLWQPTRSTVAAQVPAKTVIGRAEVTAADVYVRSGPSANHYPVDKVKAGARVTVVGQMGDWLEILPIDTAYSFISGDYVDSADGKTGTVNADRVNVRAGSALPAFSKSRYKVQMQLSRGAKVTILQREPDGFLRIKSPPGATLWIHRDLVEFVPGELVRLEGETGSKPSVRTPAAGAAGVPVNTSLAAIAPTGAATATPSPLTSGADKTPYRTRLEELDKRTKAELAKPVIEREFAPLIEPFGVIAEQEQDDFARRYARARIQQLTRMQALVDAVRRMRRISDEASSQRRAFLEDRARIGERRPPIPTPFTVQGTLRPSVVYPAGTRHARYRLVETVGSNERTLAYVEIPNDAGIDVEAFLGRYVGVRTSARRLQAGGVDAVPIYVAQELIPLQPAVGLPQPAGN